eukprot:scaffold357670_cov14-Prasinocladus_malaysianus.AAC.1
MVADQRSASRPGEPAGATGFATRAPAGAPWDSMLAHRVHCFLLRRCRSQPPPGPPRTPC